MISDQLPKDESQKTKLAGGCTSNVFGNVASRISTYSSMSSNAIEPYEYLDDRALQVVQQEEPSEAINQRQFSDVAQDLSVLEMLALNRVQDSHTRLFNSDKDDEGSEIGDPMDEASPDHWPRSATLTSGKTDDQPYVTMGCRFTHGHLLAEQEAFLGSVDHSDGTILHRAALHNQLALLNFLILLNFDVLARDSLGRIALHVGMHGRARSSTTERINLLLDAGLSIDAGTHNMETALHTASRYGNTTAVEYLLTKGASPSAQGPAGTPLHEAMDI
ncbi:MAG: hypothetical protein Q9224_002613 [Gallowayella concinna]